MSLYLGTELLKEHGEAGGNVQTQTAFPRGKNLRKSPNMWLRGPQISMDAS